MIERKDRAGLRQHFIDKANYEKSSSLISEQSAILSRINDTQIEAFNSFIRYLEGKVTKTEVVNQLKGFATSFDVEKVIKLVQKLDETIVSTKLDIKPLIQALDAVKGEITAIPDKMPKPLKPLNELKVTNLKEVVFDTEKLEKVIKALKLDVKVDAPIINTEKVDLKPLKDVMLDLLKSFNKQKQALQEGGSVKVSNLKDIPATDLKKVEEKLDTSNKHLKTIAEKKFSSGGGGGNGTPYTDSNGKPMNVVLSADGEIPVAASLGDLSIDTIPYGIAYGPVTDTGYFYLAYEADDGSWYMKRKDTTTYQWTYCKGASDLATAWADKAGQTWVTYDVANGVTSAAAVLGSDVTSNNEHIATEATLEEVANNTGNIESAISSNTTAMSDGTQQTKIIGRTGDSTYEVPRMNPETNVLNIIDYAHHEIHRGSSFFYTDSVELNSTGVQNYLITTPDTTEWAHMTFRMTGSAITTIQIYEAADRTGTTAQTVFNHDRNSANTDDVTIHKGYSSGATDGTLIFTRKSGSATAQSRTGDEASHAMELILKQNTKYIFRVTSGTNANLTNVLFDWYSHTNRNL